MSYSGQTPFEEIVYTSSNPSVLAVNETDWSAQIFLLKPGQADLIMTFPDDGNYQIRIPFTVEDHFTWDYTINDSYLTLSVGQTNVEGLDGYSLPSSMEITHVTWTSSNPSVVEVPEQTNRPTCVASALSPGTATITATVHFNFINLDYPITDTFSFELTVKPN